MFLKRISFLFAISLLVFVVDSQSQTTSVLTAGLDHPNKLVNAANNSMLVAESGTMTANTGRISLVDALTGHRRTLIGGLPSGVSNLGGDLAPDGTTGILLRGNVLYVVNGVGDACINVGPGLESPNPAGASSPIFDSIIEITLPGAYTKLRSGFLLSLADQNALASGDPVVLTNAEGRSAVARLVANLPDYRPEPRPTAPNNVRASHLFGVEMFQGDLYVVDAGWNLIHKVNISTGSESIFATFPNRPNPRFPTIGGPFIESVPDAVHRVGNTLVVPLLTGFPFVPGVSEIRSIDLKTGTNEGLIPNLTSAIDVIQAGTSSVSLKEFAAVDESAYYTLEFSTNMLAGALGRLRYYSDPTSTPIDLVNTLVTPTSFVRNDETGEIFITNIGPGTITKVH